MTAPKEWPQLAEAFTGGARVLVFVDIEENTVRMVSQSVGTVVQFPKKFQEPLLCLVDLYRGELMAEASDELDEQEEDNDKIDGAYSEHRVDDCFQVVLDAEFLPNSPGPRLLLRDFFFQCDFNDPEPDGQVGGEDCLARQKRLVTLMEGVDVTRARDGSYIVARPCPIEIAPHKVVANRQELDAYQAECTARGQVPVTLRPVDSYFRREMPATPPKRKRR